MMNPGCRPQNRLALRPLEAADLLGVGRTTVYELIRTNQLPGVVRIGRSVRINRRVLEEWLDLQASRITQAGT